MTAVFGSHTESATTDPAGKWSIAFKGLTTGDAADLTISGKNAITLHDVLVAEVWLCSGQSNMQLTVSEANNAQQEIAAANDPGLRMYKAAFTLMRTPQQDVPGEWKVCTPENAGRFSAAGYYFGRDVRKAIHRPMGLISSSYGSSAAEAWTSREALAASPKLAPELAKFDNLLSTFDFKSSDARYAKAMENWKLAAGA